MAHSHDGPRQPKPFDPKRAALLDDPERETWLPTPAVVDALAVAPHARILDYGTGSARYAIAIARAHPDATILAYDVQPEMLELARERVVLAEVRNVMIAGPDPDALEEHAFDRVLALNVFHEIGSDDLARMRTLLDTNGILLIIDWDATIDREPGPPADHVYAPDEAMERVARAGFTVERVDEARFPYHYVLRARV